MEINASSKHDRIMKSGYIEKDEIKAPKLGLE